MLSISTTDRQSIVATSVVLVLLCSVLLVIWNPVVLWVQIGAVYERHYDWVRADGGSRNKQI